MNIRSDSPLFGIEEEEIDELLWRAKTKSYDDLAEFWARNFGRDVVGSQVKRFVRRLKLERRLQGLEENEGMVDRFAGRAKDGRARDGVIEAARQRLFEEAMAKGDHALLLELYRAAEGERTRAQEVEVKQRRAAVSEDKAKLGWRKLELEQARSALKLLPAIREALMDGGASDGERVAKLRELLLVGGGRLLEAKNESEGVG